MHLQFHQRPLESGVFKTRNAEYGTRNTEYGIRKMAACWERIRSSRSSLEIC